MNRHKLVNATSVSTTGTKLGSTLRVRLCIWHSDWLLPPRRLNRRRPLHGTAVELACNRSIMLLLVFALGSPCDV
ncbi:hypothetical protein BJX99DRAFT_179848 [Aspergillus californicus]